MDADVTLMHAISVMPNNPTLITAGEDGRIKFWDIHNQNHVPFNSLTLGSPISAVTVDPDGKCLAYATDTVVCCGCWIMSNVDHQYRHLDG